MTRPTLLLLCVLAAPLHALQSAQDSTQPPTPAQPPAPTGTVLFERTTPPPATEPAPAPVPTPAPANPATPQSDSLAVTDTERDALTFTAYDLDVHLTPASAAISVRSRLIVKNDGPTPLTRLVLDLSSSLHWDAFSTDIFLDARRPTVPLTFVSHLVDTDADHTGRMSEAIVRLPQPLAPGASVSIIALYSGTIAPSAERLERIGAPPAEATSADWDAIATDGTALRGFGNVLWYPVAAAPVFLGDGAKLFQAVGRAKLRQSTASVRLRLAIEYVGDPPSAAFFCGRREQLIAISDNSDVPIAESPGIATTTFDARPLGFRTPSLFVTGNPASLTGTPANPDLIDAVTDRYDTLPAYSAAATLVVPLMTDWMGAQPRTSLSIIDHPGQPFEDDTLLVLPMRALDPATLAPSLAHSLTHAWFRSSHAWIDEGLAQFMSLLWTERTAGRAAALADLQDEARSLALIEPEVPASASVSAHDRALPAPRPPNSSVDPSSQTSSSSSTASAPPQDAPVPTVSPAGESLAAATGDVFYRTKAAAVWWMLRAIVGDDALKQSLQAYRADATLDRDPAGLERTIEKISHKDLHWLFNDWVYKDLGLPDLNIVSVTPSQLESHAGLPAGWLVAVVVHNNGYAEAEVPVTVRSSTASETQRLRIPGRTSASTRIVFAGTPERVEVNDGGVPETQASIHIRQLQLPGR